MKIALITVGTRGDLEPFLAVGKLLLDRGHRITCLAPEQYVPLIRAAGLEAAGLDPRFLDLLEGADGEAYMGGRGSPFRRAGQLLRLAREGLRINRLLVQQQIDFLQANDFDRVVFHPKASFPFVWAVDHSGKAVILSPVPWVIHPVAGHAHLGMDWLGKLGLARASYRLVNFGLLQNILPATRAYRRKHGIRRRQVVRAIAATPMAYAVSPAVFERPTDWPDHVRVLGFHPRIPAAGEADREVEEFMERHAKFLVVTFGSMRNPDPAAVTRILLTALKQAGIPAILNRAGGGLEAPADYDRERYLFTDVLDYARVFPRAAGVIHHGGAGTTQTALRHGRPALIVPHIVDQFAWDRLIASRRLGPAGIPVRDLTVDSLGPKVQDLVSDSLYRRRAAETGTRMRGEDLAGPMCDFLTGASAIP